MAISPAYKAGHCNIGRHESRRRYMTGWMGVVLSVLLWVGLVCLRANWLGFLLLCLPVVMAVVGFRQARAQFCVYYAITRQQNVTDSVPEPIQRRGDWQTDMISAVSLLLQSVSLALVVTILAMGIGLAMIQGRR